MSLESPALAGGFFTAEPRGEPSGHKVWRWSQQSPHPLEAQKCKFPGPRESEALEVGPVICGFLKYLFNWLFMKLQYFGHLMQRADSFEKT